MRSKKTNANKRVSTFAKATADKGKKGWGSGVACAMPGQVEERKRTDPAKSFFTLPQVPTFIGNRALQFCCQFADGVQFGLVDYFEFAAEPFAVDFRVFIVPQNCY